MRSPAAYDRPVMPKGAQHLLRTILAVTRDLASLAQLVMRSRAQLAAESLFLRKQLAYRNAARSAAARTTRRRVAPVRGAKGGSLLQQRPRAFNRVVVVPVRVPEPDAGATRLNDAAFAYTRNTGTGVNERGCAAVSSDRPAVVEPGGVFGARQDGIAPPLGGRKEARLRDLLDLV